MRNSSESSPLRLQRNTAELVPWRLVTPQLGESCRWAHLDGRWVALTLGEELELGHVVVSGSDGRRELVDSYEAALELARRWRRR